MRKSISHWQIVGFLFTSIFGTFLHFLFDLSGQSVIAALFSAVNESIWEHMKLGMEESDATIADLMTDGCNMGVKSLNKYLNQYEAADEISKDITKRLINLEQQLTIDIRKFL